MNYRGNNMEENSKIGKKVTDYVKKSQNREEIHWQPVANSEEQEKKESEALQKPDFYNRILLIRSGR